jgi:hypothetical protein
MVYLLGCAWAFASAGGCQLIIGDLPGRWDGGEQDDLDGALDAASDPDAGAVHGDAQGEEAGEPPRDAAQQDAREEEDASDAEPMDAAGGTDADGSAPPAEAGLPDADPSACDGAGEKVFYRDMDDDGYGDAQNSVRACSTPSGYVGNDDDCHDGRDDVHPGQSDFFAQGYLAGSGSESFDYDCDGHEVAGSGQDVFSECSGGLLSCAGGGYKPNPNREDLGTLAKYCGSNLLVSCGSLGALTGCGEKPSTTDMPFVCH